MKCPKCHTENPDTSHFCADCGTQLLPKEDIPVTETAETPKEELTTGSTFAGRYQIIEELGKGGMGKVYKAHDTEINEKVAIKLIKPEVAADKKTIERFKNELKFARKIRHKNVCQMYDLGEEKGTRYITMEFVPGEDLKRLIRKMGQMPVGKAISIAKQVCEGLTEAHKLGVIHRDLKPRNIMVDEEGNARIMDFGIARFQESRGITDTGTAIGTPEYMSPEQVEGEEVDHRSDIYSSGVILYEMLTGDVPFGGKTPLGIAVKHKTEFPREPREFNPQIPDELNQLVMRCLEKNRERRYQNTAEILDELTRIERDIPTKEMILERKKSFFWAFLRKLKERKIIHSVAAFVGGGAALIEFAHHILVGHYHLPKVVVDYIIAALILAMLSTVSWQWFRAEEIARRKGRRILKIIFKWIAALIVVTLLIAVVITALIIWQPWSQKEAVPIPSDKPSIAIMYFENNTGDESLDHWRKMFSDLLITDLTQSKYLRVLSGDRLFKILKDINQFETKTFSADVLKEVADRGRVRHLLLGKYAKMGDTFRIDIVLQEARTGEIVSSLRVEARGEEEIFPKIDELTRKIKTNFELSPEEIASDIDKEVGKITTSSPEAYRYYSEGKKSYDRGDERKAIQFYEKAVAIDPEFATAYMDMAISYGNLGLFSEQKKCLQKALALSHRVSDRERYLNEAQFYTQSEKTYDKAIEAFNKLLKHYPEDVDGNADLGWVYIQLEQWDKAIERYKVNVQNRVEEVYTHANLASLYEAKGLYDKAKDVLEYYLNNFSDNYYIRWCLAYNYLSQGKYDLALVEADKAFFLDPTHYDTISLKGDIYLFQGDLIKAEAEYQKLLNAREPLDYNWGLASLFFLNLLQGKFEKAESLGRQLIEFANKVGEDTWKSLAHLGAARHYLRLGNPERALKECDEAWNIADEADYLSGQRRALYNKGLVFLELKEMDEAQRAADDLKEMIEKGMNKKLMRLYYNLTGSIELERGNFSEAIEYFKKALSLLSFGPLTKRADFIDSLALAYYKSGDLEKAREEYERITYLTTGRFYYGDLYAKSFYMLGKIHEQQGDTTKAIEHYEKFLALWKDADPGIAEVEDAKKRLDGLRM